MYLQDFLSALDIRVAYHNLAVKTSRTQQCRVQNVAAGCCHHDNAGVGSKAVHLNQQLVEGLLPFVVSAAESCSTLTTDRINLVDKDDAWGGFLSLVEQVAHTGCTDADEHLYKVRTGDGIEWDACLSCNCAGKQGLTGSGRTHQQHALRDAGTQSVKLFRVFQKIYDLYQLFLLFIRTGNVGKGHPSAVLHRFWFGFSEGVHLAASAACLTHHKNPQQRHAAQQQQGRQQGCQQRRLLCREVVAFEGCIVGLFILLNVGLDVLIELRDACQLIIHQLVLALQPEGEGAGIVVDLILRDLSLLKVIQYLIILQCGNRLIQRHHCKQQYNEQAEHCQVHDDSL